MECDMLADDHDDPNNPFAPPSTGFVRERPSVQFGDFPFTVAAVLRRTWSLFRERMWLCIGVVWGVIALELLSQILGGIILTALGAVLRDQPLVLLTDLAINVVVLVVQIWLGVGMCLTLLKVARRQEAVFGDVFTGGPFLLRTIGAAIPVMAIALAMVSLGCIIAGFLAVRLPVGIAQPMQFLITVPFVVVTGLVVTELFCLLVRFGQFFYLVIDQNGGVIDSLRLSWQLTKNRVWTLIKIFILQVGIVLAGVLACLVGVIFAVPLAILLQVVSYLILIGNTGTAAKPSLQTWELPGFVKNPAGSETGGAKPSPEV